MAARRASTEQRIVASILKKAAKMAVSPNHWKVRMAAKLARMQADELMRIAQEMTK